MAKRRDPGSAARGSRVLTAAKSQGTSGTATRVRSSGGRAVPGKVPRGSLPSPDGAGFTQLCRFILDRIDRGVVLLDEAGCVIDANDLAQRVLANSSGLAVRNGRLCFADAGLEERFGRLLRANGRAGNGSTALAACITRQGAAPHRVLISLAQPDGDPRNVKFVALIFAPDEQREISLDVLGQLYGLTRAQADVARKLYAGYSVEETAEELDLSLNTVRTHLKQIFSKCEVQSQAELLHTLAVGPHSL
jgi:DNA-binding CsgD family transcriptional regulator